MREFGLIGLPLSHSFSKKYFTEKFAADRIPDAVYNLFELSSIAHFPDLLKQHPNLSGLNVTIPYKQAVIPFLDALDPIAARIGAVNVIKFQDGKLVGHNSDYQGFLQSLQEFYPCYSPSQALVLGSGGASKAVQLALESLNIPFRVVSREPLAGQLSYDQLSPTVVSGSALIINATPAGTFPANETCPPIPYDFLSPHHFLYDLVYNPEETLFLKRGKERGAKTKNGIEMLSLQAEVAWQIWNS